MKKNLCEFLRIKGIFLILTLFTFLSCQKEENIPLTDLPSKTEDNITYKGGRLIFKDEAAFLNHQQWLYENQTNRQLIAEKNKSFGLKSMTEYYFEGMELEESDPLFLTYVDKYPNIFNKVFYDNSTLYMLPHSKLLCYVANKDGIYQIGDKIYRIAEDCIYELNNGDESKMKMLYLPKDQISDKDIKIVASFDAKGSTDWGQNTRPFTDHSFRIVSSVRYRWDTYYNYYDIVTNPQHRVLGIWGRAQLATRSANGNGYFAGNLGSGDITPHNDENTGLSVLTILTLFSGSYVYPDLSYVPAYSRGRLNTEYIYIYWPDAWEGPPPPVEWQDWIPGVNEPF